MVLRMKRQLPTGAAKIADLSQNGSADIADGSERTPGNPGLPLVGDDTGDILPLGKNQTVPLLTFDCAGWFFRGFVSNAPDEVMKPQRLLVLCLVSLCLAGCARLTNMMTFNGVSEIPPLTEPDLDDE